MECSGAVVVFQLDVSTSCFHQALDYMQIAADARQMERSLATVVFHVDVSAACFHRVFDNIQIAIAARQMERSLAIVVIDAEDINFQIVPDQLYEIPQISASKRLVEFIHRGSMHGGIGECEKFPGPWCFSVMWTNEYAIQYLLTLLSTLCDIRIGVGEIDLIDLCLNRLRCSQSSLCVWFLAHHGRAMKSAKPWLEMVARKRERPPCMI
mmetsp:Transcript_22863/g.63737  ORF Transcript_22863/g.63737 Transcript_22863/m.63737 type:complete len:210 (-) Transcript_22863:124-753(-)